LASSAAVLVIVDRRDMNQVHHRQSDQQTAGILSASSQSIWSIRTIEPGRTGYDVVRTYQNVSDEKQLVQMNLLFLG
jgi:hypothetical protein